jgi:hypothetical protein
MLGPITVSCYAYDGGDYADSDEITAHQDIYKDTTVWNDTRETIVIETGSHLNQTFGLAQSKGKFEAIQALQDGDSEGNATDIATEKVDDLYTAQQMRVYRWKNREVIQPNKSLKTIEETDLNLNDVYNGVVTDDSCDYSDLDKIEIDQGNVTLFNGTEMDTYGATMYPQQSCSPVNRVLMPVDLSNTGNQLISKDYDTANTTEAVDGAAYTDLLNDVEAQRSTANDNVIGIVDDLYANYNPDDVDVSDMTGPLEMLIYGSTNYEDTGLYSYRALSAEQAGYASNTSYAFEVEWEKMLEKTLRGPIMRILEAMGVTWEEVKNGQEQTGLGQYM